MQVREIRTEDGNLDHVEAVAVTLTGKGANLAAMNMRTAGFQNVSISKSPHEMTRFVVRGSIDPESGRLTEGRAMQRAKRLEEAGLRVEVDYVEEWGTSRYYVRIV